MNHGCNLETILICVVPLKQTLVLRRMNDHKDSFAREIWLFLILSIECDAIKVNKISFMLIIIVHKEYNF